MGPGMMCFCCCWKQKEGETSLICMSLSLCMPSFFKKNKEEERTRNKRHLPEMRRKKICNGCQSKGHRHISIVGRRLLFLRRKYLQKCYTMWDFIFLWVKFLFSSRQTFFWGKWDYFYPLLSLALEFQRKKLLWLSKKELKYGHLFKGRRE